MKEPSKHRMTAEFASRWTAGRAGTDMLIAAICLIGAIATYSVCLLLGEPLCGFEDPLHTLATRTLKLAWALIAAAMIACLLQRGLSAEAKGWQKAVAAIVLASPYMAAALCHAFLDESMPYIGIAWWIEITLWPLLSALLAHMLLTGGRPLGKGTALYGALCFALIFLATGIEGYQHDYIETFFMAVVSIGVWLVAIGGSRRLGWRGWAVIIVTTAGLAAALLAIVLDWRFWDILDEPGYAGIWIADRLESLRRFISFDMEGWDCIAERNALFAISSVSGLAAAAYTALSIASAVFMVRACGKLTHLMHADVPEPDSLAVCACGVAYVACISIGLASELLNITTCIGPVRGLGIVPATIMLTAALLGRSALVNSENP